jgi:hypothetical protein
MYRHRLDLHLLQRPTLLIHPNLLHLIQHLLALQHLPKHRILPIQMRGRGKRNEELAPVRIRPFVRHADYAARIVAQRRAYFVFKELVRCVVDGCGGFGFGVRCGAASLDHEVWDEAVEGGGVVEGGGAEGEEIFGGLGNRVAEDFELDGAEGGVELVNCLVRFLHRVDRH